MEQNIETSSNLKLAGYAGESLAALEAFILKHDLSIRKMAKACSVSHTTLHRAVQGSLISTKNFARIQRVLETGKPFYAGDEPEPILKTKPPTPREIAARLAALEESNLRLLQGLHKANAILERIEIELLGKPPEIAQKRENFEEKRCGKRGFRSCKR